VLILHHVKDVPFSLGAFELLHKVVVPHLGHDSLSSLLDFLWAHLLLFFGSGGCGVCCGCLLGLSFAKALFIEHLSEFRVDFLFISADGSADDLLLLLVLHAHFEVHVELLLRGDHDLVRLRQQLLQDVVCLSLTLKSLSELLSAVLAESNSLVAAGRLDIFFSKHESSLL